MDAGAGYIQCPSMSDRPFTLIQGGAQPGQPGQPDAPEPPTNVRPDVAAHLVDWLFSPADPQAEALSAALVIGRIRSLLTLVNDLQDGVATSLANSVAATGSIDLLEKHLLEQRDVFMRRFVEREP